MPPSTLASRKVWRQGLRSYRIARAMSTLRARRFRPGRRRPTSRSRGRGAARSRCRRSGVGPWCWRSSAAIPDRSAAGISRSCATTTNASPPSGRGARDLGREPRGGRGAISARTRCRTPTLVDEDHAVFDAYDVTSRLISLGQRPALFVIDADGVVRFERVGTQQYNIPPERQGARGRSQSLPVGWRSARHLHGLAVAPLAQDEVAALEGGVVVVRRSPSSCRRRLTSPAAASPAPAPP